ncbi:hypothetical protein DPMN_062965 [Dreissena polymorpha]|uniref:Uncharacterized protein n=1 Tax=Dreissena polymorpha TaxID=45954 RepID=A0A9D4C9M0_DREPO|nr:hypothetical protein DPMN_062965 [Dreissena polymorpha]
MVLSTFQRPIPSGDQSHLHEDIVVKTGSTRPSQPVLQWLLGNSLQFRFCYSLYKTYFRSPWKSQDNPGDPVRK